MARERGRLRPNQQDGVLGLAMGEESLSHGRGGRGFTPLGKGVMANGYKMGLRYSRCSKCFFFTLYKVLEVNVRVVNL